MATQFTLSDGRKLDYWIGGRTDGIALLHFHGTPGAYIMPAGIEAACKKHGLAVIAFSRPGYGTSTRQKGRRVIDTVADAAELLKHLGHSRCYVMGESGGGPYTFACAAKLPGCIAALSVAGVAPYEAEGLDFLAGQGQDNIDEFNAALRGEEDLQAYVKPVREAMLTSKLEDMIEALSSVLPDVDKAALRDNADLGQHFIKSTAEALKVNSDGWVDDDLAFTQPWGIDVKDVKVPILIYQGDLDAMVPFAQGKWLAAHAPKELVTEHFEHGQGHISILVGKEENMIQELVNAGK